MSEWVTTGTALPKDGERVQFVVERRSVTLCGTYVQCMFRSRWSQYSPVEVVEWRRIGEDAVVAATLSTSCLPRFNEWTAGRSSA